MKDIKKMFSQTDFSRYTDLNERLAKQLFSANTTSASSSSPFQQLSDNQIELVNAAQGLFPQDENSKKH